MSDGRAGRVTGPDQAGPVTRPARAYSDMVRLATSSPTA